MSLAKAYLIILFSVVWFVVGTSCIVPILQAVPVSSEEIRTLGNILFGGVMLIFVATFLRGTEEWAGAKGYHPMVGVILGLLGPLGLLILIILPHKTSVAIPVGDSLGAMTSTKTGIDALQVSELRAFIGPNADYYLGTWWPKLLDTTRSAGLNWAALFLSGAWLPFRKMYRIAAIVYGVFFLESIVVEEILLTHVLKMPDASAILGRLSGITLGIVCGLFGNRWYLSHATKRITELRAHGLTTGAFMQALSKQGGTSVLSALGALALFFAAYILSLLALEVVFSWRHLRNRVWSHSTVYW